ncbi:MAG: ASCH domain-containing protein [Candidatus Methylacidiphilales bacterium]|nr:ASCH domain-containing protein [Candidatus Methylacidiphilales bacterium]
MIFQALSIVHPAVERILRGEKTLEIRQWAPDVLPLRHLLLVQNRHRLGSAGIREDPDGRALALADVLHVRPWTRVDCAASCSRPEAWEPGWLAWELTHVRPVTYPHPVPARLRLYSVDLDIDVDLDS